MTAQEQSTAEKARPVVSNILVIVDHRSGRRGTYAEWVAAFQERWSDARANLDRFMDILSPDIILSAPGLKTTRGREAGYQAFAKTFAALPDLTGTVHRWSASGDALFIEMTFAATIGGRRVEWHDVDRFRFKDGAAIERVAYFDPTPIRRAYLGSLAGLRQLWRMRRVR